MIVASTIVPAVIRMVEKSGSAGEGDAAKKRTAAGQGIQDL